MDHRRWASLSTWPGPALAAAVALCYFALAQYVIWLNDPVRAGAGYWPAGGVTVAALLLLPMRRWGWVVGAVVVAEIGGDALHGYPLAASSWWAAGNVAEPLTAALLLARRGGGRLVPLPGLVLFLLAGVVVGPLVGAAIGSIGTSSVYEVSRLDVFLKWWVVDGLGVLVVAPLVLSFREPSVPGRSRWEIAGTMVAIATIASVAFRNWNQEWDGVLPYLVLPALLWAGVRLGVRGAAVAGVLIAEIANLATALGYGPVLAITDPVFHGITSLQVFLGAALTSGLLVAVLVHDTVAAAGRSQRHRAVAEAFQFAALPQQLPTVPGLSIAAGYRVAADDEAIRIGGDWYDAFPLPDGSVAFVVGDVTGHDLSAAIVMAQVRNGLRSLLIERPDPGNALAAMDAQLAANAELTLATAIAAVYTDGELRWANAGHPPLVVVHGSGRVRYLTAEPGRILGVGGYHYDTHRTHLEPGDSVIGYTDGVMEHRVGRSTKGWHASLSCSRIRSTMIPSPYVTCSWIRASMVSPARTMPASSQYGRWSHIPPK